MSVYYDSDLGRFWAKVDKSGDCWLWTASVNNKGYGDFSLGRENKHVLAHRFSFTLANGPINPGDCVLHRCDTPRCVRPDHLFLGSVGDNNRDMWAKGRGNRVTRSRGEGNPHSKLTEDQVREIRKLRQQTVLTLDQIGSRFGVCGASVQHIVKGKSWRHVQ